MKRKVTLLANIGIFVFFLVSGIGILEVVARVAISKPQWPLQNVAVDKKIAFVPRSAAQYKGEDNAFTITTNEFGRRDSDWAKETIDDESGILFIGDSFALGYGVEDKWTIPAQLEALFKAAGEAKEVFNFGMAGDIAIPEYEELLKEALRIGVKAKTVVIGIFIGNDFSGPSAVPARQTVGPARYFEFFKQSKTIEIVKNWMGSSPQMISLALTIGSWFHTPVYLSPAAAIFVKEAPHEEVEKFNRQLAGLSSIEELCKQNGRDLFLVLFPNKIQVEIPSLENKVYDFNLPNRRILEFCEKHHFSCLDLLPLLRNEYRSNGEPLYFSVDRHFNERGNQVAAKYIFEFIRHRYQSHSP